MSTLLSNTSAQREQTNSKYTLSLSLFFNVCMAVICGLLEAWCACYSHANSDNNIMAQFYINVISTIFPKSGAMPDGNDNHFKEKDRLRLGAFTLHNRHSTVACGGLEVGGRRSFLLFRRAFGVKRQFNVCVRRRISWNRVDTWLLHNHRHRAAWYRLCYPVTQKGESCCY